MPNFYIVDFEDELNVFSSKMAHPSLPTIDTGVAVWFILDAFGRHSAYRQVEEEFIQTAMRFVCNDHLIETPEWTNKQEEMLIKQFIYDALMCMGKGMYDKLVLSGLYPTGTERYTIAERPLNDCAYVFTRCSTAPT